MDDWKQLNPYCMTNGTYTIAKFFDGSKNHYGLFKGKQDTALGFYGSFEEAKERVNVQS